MRDRRAVRLALTVLLFGCLGFVTSVAVAWGATVWFITLTPMHQSYNLAWQVDRTSMTIAASARQGEGGALHWSNNSDRSFPAWSRFQDSPISAQKPYPASGCGVCLDRNRFKRSAAPSPLSIAPSIVPEPLVCSPANTTRPSCSKTSRSASSPGPRAE